jgi:hypothetical protein
MIVSTKFAMIPIMGEEQDAFDLGHGQGELFGAWAKDEDRQYSDEPWMGASTRKKLAHDVSWVEGYRKGYAKGWREETDETMVDAQPHNFAAYRAVYIDAAVRFHDAACNEDEERIVKFDALLKAFEECYPEIVMAVKESL